RRRAQQRRKRVVGATHRIEVVLDSVAGAWLDDHPGPVGLQCPANMASGPAWVAHVVQAVKHRPEVVVIATVRRRRLGLETDSVGDSDLLGPLARSLDRAIVV